MLVRLGLIKDFRLHVLGHGGAAGADQLRDATRALVECLESLAAALGPAAAWLELPPERQEARTNSARTACENLVGRGFRAVNAPPAVVSPATADALAIAS